MIKKLLGLCMIFAILAILVRCGRFKGDGDDDSGSAPDSRVPSGWDGKSDYTGSSFNIQTKNN